jgi:hypothetical protein
MDRILAGRTHELADVPVVNVVAGLEDDPLERMPPGLWMGVPDR